PTGNDQILTTPGPSNSPQGPQVIAWSGHSLQDFQTYTPTTVFTNFAFDASFNGGTFIRLAQPLCNAAVTRATLPRPPPRGAPHLRPGPQGVLITSGAGAFSRPVFSLYWPA